MAGVPAVRQFADFIGQSRIVPELDDGSGNCWRSRHRAQLQAARAPQRQQQRDRRSGMIRIVQDEPRQPDNAGIDAEVIERLQLRQQRGIEREFVDHLPHVILRQIVRRAAQQLGRRVQSDMRLEMVAGGGRLQQQ